MFIVFDTFQIDPWRYVTWVEENVMFLIQFTQIRPALHRSVADTMYTFAKDPLGLALLLAMTIASSADTAGPLLAASRCLGA